MKTRLKVTNIRYFETRRGLGYQCQTNVPNVQIWNDGDGGGTYIPADNFSKYYCRLSEDTLESLIDEYEGITSE